MASNSRQQLESLENQLINGNISEKTYLELKAKLEAKIKAESSPEVPLPGKASSPGVPSPGKDDSAGTADTISLPQRSAAPFGDHSMDYSSSDPTVPPPGKTPSPTGSSAPFGVQSAEMPLVTGMEIGADMPDKEIKRYRVGELLGKGGWGAVFCAEDRQYSPARAVALKAIFTTATADEVARKRIEREARLGTELAHPNVVRIGDFTTDMGVYFLIMELVSGGDLNSLRARQPDERFSLEAALPLLKDIAEGLDYLHSKGIIHRDLKPSNLLWHPDEKRLKISDFGLSKTARDSILLSGAKMPSISGTDPYMAPEIWNAEDPSKAGDLYALGIIAYEMLKGDPPFRGPNFPDQHRNAPVKPIPELPDMVNTALEKILSKEPSSRFTSGHDFVQALEKPPLKPKVQEVQEPAEESSEHRQKPEQIQRDEGPDNQDEEVVDYFSKRKKKVNPFLIILVLVAIGVSAVLVTNSLRSAANRREAQRLELLGDSERDQNDWADAINYYEQALEIGGENSVITSKLSDCRTSQREAEAAAAEAERRRRATPGYISDGPLANMHFAYIPAGSFIMGSTPSFDSDPRNDVPQHRVTLDAFQMMTTEVTQAMWQEVMGSNPSHFTGNTSHPVEQVSWNDVQDFLRRLNQRDRGKGYRLPTEAEWEYACRAGTTTCFYSGERESDLSNVGWYGSNSSNTTHQVRQKAANVWGLYDMHGNVWEWCNDRYDRDYYFNSPARNPRGPSSGDYRVARGGSIALNYWDCYSTTRGGWQPNFRSKYNGFRIVRSAQ